MHFYKPEDYKLLQTLLNESVITMTEFQKWEKPEEGLLMRSAIENADKIDEKKWIAALIKLVHIQRYEAPKVEPIIFSSLNLDIPTIRLLFDQTIYPLTIINNAIWLGMLRLDSLEHGEYKALFEDFSDVFYCAITPKEANLAEMEYRRYAKQTLKTVELEPDPKHKNY